LRRVRGKFAIYSIDDGTRVTRPVAAADAVRQLVALVAGRYGPSAAVIDDAVALEAGVLMKSTHARVVKVGDVELYVATNLSRSWAEEIMRAPLDRAPGSGWRVIRAGDVLAEAPPAKQPETTTEAAVVMPATERESLDVETGEDPRAGVD